MSVANRTRLAPATVMALVRAAMVLGTVAFGGIVWLLQRQGRVHVAVTSPRLRAYRDAAMVVWVAASVALGTLTIVRQRVLEEARERTLTVLAWTVGELVAVLGAVFYLLSDRLRFYALGLIFLAVALLISPLRRME